MVGVSAGSPSHVQQQQPQLQQLQDVEETSLSPADLMYLLRYRFLDVLLIDLSPQRSVGNNGEEVDALGTACIYGSYQLSDLGQQLYDMPSPGSAIYSITCHTKLRSLLSNLQCPFVVICDNLTQDSSAKSSDATRNHNGHVEQSHNQNGSSAVQSESSLPLNCPAITCVKMIKQVEKLTSDSRRHGSSSVTGKFKARWFKYLRGGKSAFKSQYPFMFTSSIPADIIKIAESMDIIDSDSPVTGNANTGLPANPSRNATASQISLQVALNGNTNDDPPCAIIPDFLYLGGIQSTRLSELEQNGICHILSLGEYPLILDPEQSGRGSFVNALDDHKELWELEEQSHGTDWLSEPQLFSPLTSPLSQTGGSGSGGGSLVSNVTSSTSGKRSTASNKRQCPSYTIYRLNSKQAEQQFHIHHFEIEDASHSPIESLFKVTSALIASLQSQKQKVLVHCYGGVSRSATVVLAYLMTRYNCLDLTSTLQFIRLQVVGGSDSGDCHQKLSILQDKLSRHDLSIEQCLIPNGPMTLAEAFATVFRQRPWIRPNDGFWQKLEALEIDERLVSVARNISRQYSRGGVSLSSAASSPNKSLSSSVHTTPAASSVTSPVDKKHTHDGLLPLHLRRRSLVNSLNNVNSGQTSQSQSQSESSQQNLRSTQQQQQQQSQQVEYVQVKTASWDRGRRHKRSETLRVMEQEALALSEGTLSRVVMRGCRVERVRQWLLIRMLYELFNNDDS
ncbi:hypothetical protein MP228_002563 [Amoeboaphelidium protococcarum]|nr:hypothetical protein MP228_002563 [Amoeboaphelidium protococcarum]